MSRQKVELDLADVVPSVSGPKRPHDRVAVSAMRDDFLQCLGNKVRTDISISKNCSDRNISNLARGRGTSHLDESHPVMGQAPPPMRDAPEQEC